MKFAGKMHDHVKHMGTTADNVYVFGALEVDANPSPAQRTQRGLRRTYFLLGALTAAIGVALIISLSVAYAVNWTKPSSSTSSRGLVPQQMKGNVTVYYAASLNDLMSRFINLDFTISYGYRVKSLSAASGVISAKLQAGAAADVFISAAVSNDLTLLASTLPASAGQKQGKVITWYATFAKTRLGIGYNINSPFRSTFEAILGGALPWYEALDTTKYHLKLGRTDPNLDPKGYRTVIAARLAEIYYKQPGIAERILGTPLNNLQIYTEENLEALLEQGNIDVGFFYECEHPWDGNMRFIPLPTQMDFSNASLNSFYSKANYTNSLTGVVSKGAAIVYTITIPTRAANPEAATAYVENLLSLQGSLQLNGEGLYPSGPTFAGNLSAVPSMLLAK